MRRFDADVNVRLGQTPKLTPPLPSPNDATAIWSYRTAAPVLLTGNFVTKTII